MKRLRAMIWLDVRQQARANLYLIGIVVSTVLGCLTRYLIPEAYLSRLIPIFYITVLGGTTFMFGAAMIVLERSSGTLDALRTSMVTNWDYVLSKVITLTVFALVESTIVYAIAGRGQAASPGWLVLGVVVLGTVYTFVGLGFAASHATLQSFLFPTGAMVAMVLQLPFLAVLDIGPSWVWSSIPSRAPLLLMQAGFGPLTLSEWGYALGVGVAAVVASAVFCQARFATHVALAKV